MQVKTILTVALLLPAWLHAQTPIYNQETLQSPGTFNISGVGGARVFRTTQVTGSGGNSHFVLQQADNSPRWALGTNTEESGVGEEGSNFSLYAYGNGFLGEYMSVRRSNGYTGLGVRLPETKLHLGVSAGQNSGLRFGTGHDAGNIHVPVGASTGGYNVDFYTWRDVYPEQIGARIRADRINVYQPNNALVQGMDLVFYTSRGAEPSSLTEAMRVRWDGNVGIGTSNADEKLAVRGTVKATKVKVTQSGWADFVFDPAYKLPSLASVEAFVRENRHLPDIPSEKEVAEDGLDVGEMNKKLLQKVEELTLYLIEQHKQIEGILADNASLKKELALIKEQRSLVSTKDGIKENAKNK